MQQTILAIGALLIIMTTVMLQQRSSMLSQELVYVRQIEIAAEDAARMRLEGLATLAFDESTVGATTTPTSTSSYQLPSNFGLDAGESRTSTPLNIDDIDDFHGFTDTLWQKINANSDSFRFAITYSVSYLSNSGAVSSTPTHNKEITATVESLLKIGYKEVKGVFSKTANVGDNINP